MRKENLEIKAAELNYSKDDFVSNQMVRWCPGCGDHAILNSFEKILPQLGVKKENFVVVSGIGCSSRFPYYVDTFGIHGIHGRALAIASGVKVANPELSVWVATGDGDAMAIGGNHFIHILRRNIDINIMLFNNMIYGLTKGQYSPTSNMGSVTKSSPQGTIENPFHPGELVIGAQGTFYARAIDTNPKLMSDIFIEAYKHTGTSLVEILQNCVIFNDKVHAYLTSRETKHDTQLILEHGKPMLFGKENEKGIVLDGLKLKVVRLGENGITEKDILVHDQFEPDPTLALMLVRMAPPKFPVALGVIRSVDTPVYEENMERLISEAQQTSRMKSVDDLLHSGNTWEI